MILKYNKEKQQILTRGDSVKQVSISSFQDGDVRSNRDSPHQFNFLISNTDKHTRKLYRDIINNHHKYKTWKDYVGRRIGWIIYDYEDTNDANVLIIDPGFETL